MSNPLISGGVQPNQSTAPMNPVNDSSKKYHQGYNTFGLSYKQFQTQRFGEIKPFFVMEGVEGDRIPLRSTHEIRSLTLRSPLMSNLRFNKDYFMVPMNAILPRTWELIYTNPTFGDDVPLDANCVFDTLYEIQDLLKFITSLEYWQREGSNVTYTDYANALKHYIDTLGLLYNMLSSDGVMSSLGNPIGKYFACDFYDDLNDIPYNSTNIDNLFSLLFSKLASYLNSYTPYITYNGKVYKISSVISTKSKSITFNEFFSIFINDISWSFTDPSTLGEDYVFNFVDRLSFTYNLADTSIPVNLSRILAYQLSCAQFYSNDFVDPIFNAQLYRDNAESFLLDYYFSVYGLRPVFSYNGVDKLYDAFSGHFYNFAQSQFLFSIKTYDRFQTSLGEISSVPLERMLGYLYLIYKPNYSLRYGDYFTGAKTRPLAVGDVSVNVDGSVSAIDMTKSIMMQRFLNSVNRSGRRFKEYVQKIMNGNVPSDYHEPKYISHTESFVSGNEVENTSNTNTGAIVTNLRSTNANFAFEVDVEIPCIIIGVSYFDIERLYYNITDRQCFHKNRFDMFNPYMQYIGDQPVYLAERCATDSYDEPYGYQLRHMEYKQRVSRISQNFIDNLPGWAFVSRENFDFINPESIRSVPSDFDEFFASLQGFGSQYFHFIICFNNVCEANRRMEKSPTIL